MRARSCNLFWLHAIPLRALKLNSTSQLDSFERSTYIRGKRKKNTKTYATLVIHNAMTNSNAVLFELFTNFNKIKF